MQILIFTIFLSSSLAYKPSGWKPSGVQLTLPNDKQPTQQPSAAGYFGYGLPWAHTQQHSQIEENLHPYELSNAEYITSTSEKSQNEKFGLPKQDYGAPKPDYAPPQQEYDLPKQEYVSPKQEYAPPKEEYEPSKQDHSPPKQYYVTPKNDNDDLYKYKTIQDKPMKLNYPPKNWQDVSSTLHWNIPFDDDNSWTKTKSITNFENDTLEQDAYRILEQIRQYRIRSNIKHGQTSPTSYNTKDYKQVYSIRKFHDGTPTKKKHHTGEERMKEIMNMFTEDSSSESNEGFETKKKQDSFYKYERPQHTTKKTPSTPNLTNTTTEINDTSDESGSEEQEDIEDDNPNIAVSNAVARQGQYYLIQPSGMLQKVTYTTHPNPSNKRPLITNLRYENVKPIRGPIYTYKNGELVQVN